MNRQTHDGAKAVALHALAVRERMPPSLLNYGPAIAQLAAVMDAERCDTGGRQHDSLHSGLSSSSEEHPSHSRCPTVSR